MVILGDLSLLRRSDVSPTPTFDSTGFDRGSLRVGARSDVFEYHVRDAQLRVDGGQILLVLLHPGHGVGGVHVLRDDDGVHHSQLDPRHRRQRLLLHHFQPLLRLLDSSSCEQISLPCCF